MKMLLLCLSATFFLSSADLPDDELKLTGSERYTLCTGPVIELPKSIEINGLRYACLPAAVLGRYESFCMQKKFSGDAILCPVHDEDHFKVVYSAFQARALKERGVIGDVDYKKFLSSFDLQKLYRCASGANACNASDVFQDCVNLLQERHRIEELIKQCAQPEKSFESIVGSDDDVCGSVARALLPSVVVPEITGCFKSSSRVFDIPDTVNVRLSALRPRSILAWCESKYFNCHISYIFRPAEDHQLISPVYFTPNIDALSIGVDAGGKCVIASCSVDTSEVKMAEYNAANRVKARGYFLSKLTPHFLTAIPKEYIITADGTKICVFDKKTKNKVFKTYDFGLLRPISVLESRNVNGENLLYIGDESGDFFIFRLDNLRENKLSLDGFEALPYTGREDDKALLIRRVPDARDSAKNRFLFVRKSGSLTCYNHEKKDKDFEHNIGKEVTALDFNPTDNTLAITGHTPFAVKLWKIGPEGMSLVWCEERKRAILFEDLLQDVCWFDAHKIFVSFKDKNKIEELDLGILFNFFKHLDDNKNDLKTMLALVVARDLINNKNRVSLDSPNIRKIMGLLPDEIEKRVGIIAQYKK